MRDFLLYEAKIPIITETEHVRILLNNNLKRLKELLSLSFPSRVSAYRFEIGHPPIVFKSNDMYQNHTAHVLYKSFLWMLTLVPRTAK